MPRDEATLLDIVRAARLAREFLGEMDVTQLEGDPKTQSAIAYQLTVLGDAARRLSREFRSAHGDVPWAKAAGMRDVLSHEYDQVDVGEIWRTVTVDLSALLTQVEPLGPDASS